MWDKGGPWAGPYAPYAYTCIRVSMAVITRGIGRSPTEKNLAELTDRIFLNLWTYPNLFKKRQRALRSACGHFRIRFNLHGTPISIRPPQTEAMRSSLLTTRSQFRTR